MVTFLYQRVYKDMDKKQIITTIAHNLRALMNQSNLSNTELARRCKISTGTISKIINGTMSITIPMAINLAEGLEVDIDVLLHGIVTTKHQKGLNQIIPNKSVSLAIGIMSINNRRYTCIKDNSGNIIGTSELEGGLDLAETASNLINLIFESIAEPMPSLDVDRSQLHNANLNLVTQSYEFEESRNKFALFAKRTFNNVIMMPDWQITYLTTFEKNQGISLVIDKGVSLSYMHEGQLKKLGGWKFPVYDLGGENWLGVETIRHTIDAFEGYVPMSSLADNVLSKFNNKIERITEVCFKNNKNNDIYSLFAEILLRSYFTGDPVAEEILQRGFKLIYRSVNKVDSILNNKVNITLNGSLADIYKPFFDQKRLLPHSSNLEKVCLLADITEDFLQQHGINS